MDEAVERKTKINAENCLKRQRPPSEVILPPPVSILLAGKESTARLVELILSAQTVLH